MSGVNHLGGDSCSMITIHRANKEEVKEIKELLSHTWKDTYGKYLSPEAIEKITSVWHDPQRLKEQMDNPNVYFVVAKDEDGLIVGLITVDVKDNSSLFMSRLYIHPNHQRKGIGSLLLEALRSEYPNAKTLELEVEEVNDKGINFYKKHEFEQLESKTLMEMGEEMKVVVMRKSY